MFSSILFTHARRVTCPAIILLFSGAAARPACGQNYNPSPNNVSASVSINYPGTQTNYSSATGGLPSVTAGGTATVTFNFQTTYSVTQGGGAAILEYLSDDQSTWAGVASLSSQTDGWVPYSRSVNVSNLSTLQFRMEATATVGQGGSANIVGSVDDLLVSVSGGSACTCTSSHVSCTDSNGSISLSTDLANATIFYTEDGSAATEASIQYTGPFAAPPGDTIEAVAVQTSSGGVQGIELQQAQKTVGDWKTVLACDTTECSPYTGEYNTPTIKDCGNIEYCQLGVQGYPTIIGFVASGSLAFPSAWWQGSATVANLGFTSESLQGTYPQSTSHPTTPLVETQVLWPYNTGTTGCDSCTSMVEDFYLWPQYDPSANPQILPSNVEEWEMDLETWDTAPYENGWGWLNAGLQCSVLKGGWEYSGQGGTWQLLKDANGSTLTHDCPLPYGTLSAAITSNTQATFTVNPLSSSTIEPGMIVLIDNEEIFCKAVSGNECTIAERGYGGTAAAAHSAGVPWAGSVHVQYHAHRNPGDLACKNVLNNVTYNVECVYIDYLNLNYYPGLGNTNNDNQNTFSGLSVPAGSFNGATYPDRVYNQQQMNVAYKSASTSSPAPVGEYLDVDDVTASWGVLASGSCAVPQ